MFLTRIHFRCLCSLLLCLGIANAAEAQKIQIERRPPPDGEQVVYHEWRVSYSKNLAPGDFDYSDRGPFATLIAAQAEAKRLQEWNARMRTAHVQRAFLIAAIKIVGYPTVVTSGPGIDPTSPVGQQLVGASERIDGVLRQARDVATRLGVEIPDAGDVLNEYREVVEMSYKSAKAAKEGLTEIVKTAAEDEIKGINELINQMMQSEPEAFLERKSASKMQLAMNEYAEKSRKQQQGINELADKIAATKDPDASKKLMEELDGAFASGELREAVVAQGKYQRAKDEFDSAKRHLDSIDKILADGKKTQDEILAKLGPKPNSPLSGSWTGTATITFVDIYGRTISRNYDNLALSFAEKDNQFHAGGWFAETGTWSLQGDAVQLKPNVLAGFTWEAKLRLRNGEIVGEASERFSNASGKVRVHKFTNIRMTKRMSLR